MQSGECVKKGNVIKDMTEALYNNDEGHFEANSVDPADEVKTTNTEVTLSELGQNVALSLVRVQRGLAAYANDSGTYILDEANLEIPLKLRVDNMGQILVTVVDPSGSDNSVGRLRLSIRPAPKDRKPTPPIPNLPLTDLGVLSKEVITYLESRRIFSVGDFLRLADSAPGRSVLAKTDLGVELENILGRAAVLTLPIIPETVKKAFLRFGIKVPADFLQANPQRLAKSLSHYLKQPIQPEDIEIWQRGVGEHINLPLPSRHQIMLDS